MQRPKVFMLLIPWSGSATPPSRVLLSKRWLVRFNCLNSHWTISKKGKKYLVLRARLLEREKGRKNPFEFRERVVREELFGGRVFGLPRAHYDKRGAHCRDRERK